MISTRKRRLLLAAAGGALATAASTPAWAQSAAAPAPNTTLSGLEVLGKKAGGLELETPSATGSRLGLTVLETPASIQVISGEAIRDHGDRSVLEAESRAAGLTIIPTPGNGGTALSARGFTGVASVMQLYDGLQLYVGSGTVTFPFDTWTIDRLEVLSGPASVLYGTGAVGRHGERGLQKPEPDDAFGGGAGHGGLLRHVPGGGRREWQDRRRALRQGGGERPEVRRLDRPGP